MITQVSDTIFTIDISNPLILRIATIIIFAFMTWSWLLADWIIKKSDELKQKKV